MTKPWHIPRALSNEALRLLTTLPMEEVERRLREPAPAADGEVAELVEWLRVTGELLSRRSDIQCRIDLRLFARAADLLERQSLRPIPVSERLPGPGDCDERGRCWWYDMRRWQLAGPMEDSEEYMNVLAACFSHWLPAHALPLPEVEHG